MRTQLTSTEKGQALLRSLAEARWLTDELFRVVRPDSLYERPVPERHRIIFYIGHLEAFDWDLIGRHLLDLPSFHQEFDRLFAFGIDPVDGGLPTDQPSDWPSPAEVDRYNQRLRQTLDARLEKVSSSDPSRALLRSGFVLHVALEHRLMHAETLAYMLHQLPGERKLPQSSAPAPCRAPACQPTPTAIAYRN
jgi:iron(II)-dependent oxidoreductase